MSLEHFRLSWHPFQTGHTKGLLRKISRKAGHNLTKHPFVPRCMIAAMLPTNVPNDSWHCLIHGVRFMVTGCGFGLRVHRFSQSGSEGIVTSHFSHALCLSLALFLSLSFFLSLSLLLAIFLSLGCWGAASSPFRSHGHRALARRTKFSRPRSDGS